MPFIPKVNFIGCGRLGQTIAKLLQINHLAIIKGVVNSSLASSKKAVQFIGQGNAVSVIKELPPADVYFITTADNLIQEMCDNLAAANNLKAGAIIVHCSGALSSDILNSAKKTGCHRASIHPGKSFADPKFSVKNFQGTYCAVEGDEPAVSLLKTLFSGIGGKIIPIKKTKKYLYHAAGVLANNHAVTLHYHAVQGYKSAGIPEETAKQLASLLMNDALNNLSKLDHQAALTGPLQRGDFNTIRHHLEALENYPLAKEIYRQLSLGTLPLAPHSPQMLKQLENILWEKSEEK